MIWMRFGESSEPLDTDQCKSMESQKNLQKSMEFPEKLAENDQKHIHIIKIKKSHQLSYSIEISHICPRSNPTLATVAIQNSPAAFRFAGDALRGIPLWRGWQRNWTRWIWSLWPRTWRCHGGKNGGWWGMARGSHLPLNQLGRICPKPSGSKLF